LYRARSRQQADPHGRPIVVEISESFLDKQFLRT